MFKIIGRLGGIILLFGLSCQAPIYLNQPAALQKAKENFQRQKYRAATEAYLAALKFNKYNAAAIWGLIKAQQKIGSLAELAEKVSFPKKSAYEFFFKGILAFYQDVPRIKPGISLLKKAVSLKPMNSAFLFHLGRAYFLVEEYDKAEPFLKKADALNPTFFEGVLLLAKTRYLLGQNLAALMTLKSGFAFKQLNASEVDSLKGMVGEIINPFQTLPKSTEKEYERGMKALGSQNTPQIAILIFKDLAEKYPDIGVFKTLLGLSYMRLNSYLYAIDILRRSLKTSRFNDTNYLYLGLIYYGLKNFDKAETYLLKGVEINPFNTEAYLYLLKIAEFQNNFKKAQRSLNRLIFLNPDDIEWLKKSAGLKIKLAQDLSGAIRDLRQVIKANPREFESTLLLGVIYHRFYDDTQKIEKRRQYFNQAKKYYQQARAIKPQDPSVKAYLDRLKWE